ncbi:hypothetical protein NL676_006277 [Syzygium grande]|nr:hypothetical protein NL676_006277 [Syzygium grande]
MTHLFTRATLASVGFHCQSYARETRNSHNLLTMAAETARVMTKVVEHGLGHLPFTEKQVVTPTGSLYTGVDFCKKLCGVSIVRSGESMENALRACCKGIKIGKILIHRDGDNGKQLIYEKLPKDISERHVLLLDPVLATGNSANQAIELLIQKGVPESHITFLNLFSVSGFFIMLITVVSCKSSLAYPTAAITAGS